MLIKRWKIDLKPLLKEDSYDKYLINFRKFITDISEGKDYNLHSVKNSGLVLARSSIIRRHPKYLNSSIAFYMEFGLAHLNRVYLANDLVKVQLFDTFHNMKGVGTDIGYGAHYWSDLFYCAYIIRDEKFLKRLLKIEVWKDVYDEPFNMLSALYQSTTITNNLIERERTFQELMEDSESDVGLFIGTNATRHEKVYGRSEEVKSNRLPLVLMLKAIIENDPEKFNTMLGNYLEYQKNYVIKNKRQKNKSHWINFSLLGLCSMAFDRGIKIEVESDIIPTWVYKGEFDRTTIIF